MGYRDLKFKNDAVFLVTGGAGFIGSNLCEAILEMGYTVRCLDNLSTGNMRILNPLRQIPGSPLSGRIFGSWMPAKGPRKGRTMY